MANEVDDIVQNVVLSGNEEVERGFDKIREAGERAFEGLDKALENLNSFKGLTAVLGGLAASIGIISVGVFEFVKATSETVSAMSDLAAQTGQSIEAVSAFTASMTESGVKSEELGFAFKRLSTTIQQSWTEIKKSSRDSADQLRGDAASIGQAELSLAGIQRQLSTQNRDTALQRRQNILSIADAQQRLDELNSKSLRDRGFDTSQLDAVLARQRELNELRAAETALAAAKKKAEDDAAAAAERAESLRLQQVQAEIAVNAARKKQAEDFANDINNVTRAVQQLAAGNVDALKGINASAENIAKGIINSAAQSGKAFEGLRNDITDLTAPAPGVKAVFDQMAEVFSHTNDNALKTAIAFRLLGRSVSQDMINAISLGKDKLQEMQDRVEHLGLAFTDLDKEVAEKFRSTLFQFQGDIETVQVKMSTAFGPAFTQILAALDRALIANKDTFIDFARTIGERAIPIVESFIRVLSGAPDAVKDQWLVDYTAKIAAFGRAVGELVSIVGTTFGYIITAAGKVGEALNFVFGTNLNAIDVLFAAWVARIINGFILMRVAAVEAATGTAVALAPIYAALGLLAAAIYTATKAWQAYKDISEDATHTSHWDAIFEGLISRLKALGGLIASTADALTKLASGNAVGAFKAASEGLKKFTDDWTEANRKQSEAEKGLDTVDKQIAENAAARRQRMLESEKETNDKHVDSHEHAAKEIEDAHKTAGERIAKAYQTATEQSKSAMQSLDDANKKAAESAGSVAKSAESNVDNVKRQIDEMNDALKKTGEFKTPGGARFSSVKDQTISPDGNLFGQAPKSQEQLNRMLEEQRKISESERDLQKTFSESIAQQFGKAASPTNSTNYQPPQLGRYDANGNFIPDKTQRVQPSQGAPQQLSFPSYEKFLRDTLPSNVPLPRARPPEADQQAMTKEWTDAVKQGVVEGSQEVARSRSTQDLPDQSTAIPSGPGTVPIPPNQDVPPTLFEGLQQTFRNILQSGTLNGAPQAPTTAPDTNLDSKLQSVLDGLNQFLNQKTLEPGKQDASKGLGVRGDAEGLTDDVNTASSTIATAATNVASAIDAAASAIESAVSRLSNAGSAAAPTVAAALGGYIRGAGSTTSDSILARLSDKEYVQPAHATEYYGLPFMEAVRTLRLPKFNMGGLVNFLSPTLPRFATGGPVESQIAVPVVSHLGSVDLRTNHGPVRVFADHNSVSQLRRAANMQRVSSTSKNKPGFIG